MIPLRWFIEQTFEVRLMGMIANQGLLELILRMKERAGKGQERTEEKALQAAGRREKKE